jgi:photosystem II stability/assembly factor-like uncharacterized protein
LQGSFPEEVTKVQGLTVSPLDANRVAISGTRSVWTSANGGDAWTKVLEDVKDTQQTRGSKPLVYHPTQAGELWFAGNRAKLTGSLWRTTDNGATWTAVGGEPFAKERVVTIHFFPSAPNEIWVGTAAIRGQTKTGGLWCSIDSGTTWHKVWDNAAANTKLGPPVVTSIARKADRTSVFASNTGVWQVTATDWNDPKTYTAAQRCFADLYIPNVTALADGTFWAAELGSKSGEKASAPMVSSDGVTWTERPVSLTSAFVPEWTTAEQIAKSPQVNGRDMLVQDIKNPARWLLTGDASAQLSEDGGATWRYQPGGMAGTASYGVDFDQTNPHRAYLSTGDHGMFVVNDGGLSGKTVDSSRHAFPELHTFHDVMTSPDGQTIIAAGVEAAASRDMHVHWDGISLNSPGFQTEINRTVLIRSNDGGATWEKITPIRLPLSYDGVTRSVMSMDDPNDFLVLLGYRYGHVYGFHESDLGQPNNPGLYRTKDGGKTFVQVAGNLFENADTGTRFRPELSYLERDGVNPNIRYLSMKSQQQASVRGLWRSTDGGTSWERRNSPEGAEAIAAFAVDPAMKGWLWAGTNRLRRSNDGGETWTDVANFTSITSVSSHAGRVAVIGRRKDDIVNKIFSSLDDGATWEELTNDANRFTWAQAVTVDPWRPGQVWVNGPRSFQIINPPSKIDPLLTEAPAATAPTVAEPVPKLTGTVGLSLRYPVGVSGHPAPTFKITAGELPAGLWLNPSTGVIGGTPAVAGTSNITVEATNPLGSKTATVAFEIVSGPRLSATTTPMFFQPAGSTGAVPFTITDSGAQPLTWSARATKDWLGAITPAAEGTLAPGASVQLTAAVNTAGLAEGKTTTGEIQITSNNPGTPIYNLPVRLTAGAVPAAPIIAPSQSAKAHIGGPFLYTLQASNSPSRWELTGGKLPAGMMLEPSSGALCGTPSELGNFPLQFTASNMSGTSAARSFDLTITEAPKPDDYNFEMGPAHFQQSFVHSFGATWVSNVGIGGSGGLFVDMNENALISREPTVTFTTPGQSVKMGISFFARSIKGTAGGDSLNLGLKVGNGRPMTKGHGLRARVGKMDGEPLGSVLAVNSRTADKPTDTADTDRLTVADKRWYALESTFTYDGSNSFTIVSNLYHLGEKGMDKPELVDTYSVTRPDLAALVNVPLYAGFEGRSAGGVGGVSAFDNFFVKRAAAAK